MIKQMHKILMGVFVASTMLLFSVSASHALDAEILLKLLLQKGVVTQAEYNEVMGELKDTKEKQKNWTEHVDKHITHAEGEGPALANGLSIAAGITMVTQGTIGNDDNPVPGEDVIDANISADLEISASLGEHGEAFLGIEAGDGAGLEGDEIDSDWGVNADAGASSTLTLTEAWYEHRFLNDMLTFTVGKLDLSNYFDGNEVANDETSQFLSGGFVNNLAIEFGEGPGVRFTLSPNELIDLTVGAQGTDATWEDAAEKPFLMAEADIKPKFGELQGNYRVYVWTNKTYHTEIADSANDKKSGWGYGISADQQVTDSLTLFGRLGQQNKKVYEIETALSAGVAIGGSLWSRNDDTLAFAYGLAILSDDQEDLLKAGGIKTENETHLEVYYSLVLNEYITISPDIQVVTNAKGDDDFQTVIVGGVRGQIGFN